MKIPGIILNSMLAALAFAAARPADAQSFTNVVYSLVEGSTLSDDCLFCGRPTISLPLRGTFELAALPPNPLFARYRLTNITWHAGGGAAPSYDVTGTGEYRIGGELAVLQDLTLAVRINSQARDLTNASPLVGRNFPLFEVSLVQTQNTPAQFFTLHLVAAPVREIWFSTTGSFTSAFNNLRGGPGDLLSASGRIVKSNASLIASFGFPAGASPGMDAVDIRPGGEVFYSFNESQNSPALGVIQHGDLVSDRGRVVQRNSELLSAFHLNVPGPDLGLDAVQVQGDGEVLFSIVTDVPAPQFGTLRRGDLLSSRGTIVARNTQLLASFHPGTSKDYGLDAIYVWPNGEVWFSTEEGFQDTQLGPVGAGDLLSDQGLIVFRNLELMSAFAPIEDVSSFGLDALYIVTDLTAPAPPPRFTNITQRIPSGTISLRWDGPGKVFQVLKAAQMNGPNAPLSPLMPDLTFDDASGPGFYRLRQW